MTSASGGDMNRRYAIAVIGRVQGVGYRFFARELAHGHRLTWWVRNEPCGSVAMEVQGNEKNIGVFIEQLRQGPVMSRVAEMKKTEIPFLRDERDFIIRY